MEDAGRAESIPAEIYKQILAAMPIACVDVVIPTSRGVLLVKRNNEPAKGLWWLPGGRVLKGETIAACAVRKAKDEVGLPALFERIVHVEETIFDTGPWGIPVHSVNVCVLLNPTADVEPRFDNEHAGVRWIKSLHDIPLHGYVSRCITAAGVF